MSSSETMRTALPMCLWLYPAPYDGTAKGFSPTAVLCLMLPLPAHLGRGTKHYGTPSSSTEPANRFSPTLVEELEGPCAGVRSPGERPGTTCRHVDVSLCRHFGSHENPLMYWPI